MKPILMILALACSSLAWAQHDHAMNMAPSATAHMDVQDDSATQVLTVRVGPLNLPAHSGHMAVAQAPPFFLTIPFEGWLTAYHPRLVDGSGHPEPSRLLHHVAFYNTARADFLCPNKLEHIFGAGGEMNDWAAIPGVGYRVHKGDRIRIGTMFHNPTDADYPQTWLEVKIEYQNAARGDLKSIYPAWFDVQQCGDSGYDLGPGRTLKIGEIKLDFSGLLLGVGGHMHDYGRQLELFDVTRSHTVAALKAQLDPTGKIQSMPVVRFGEGYKLNKGDVLRVSAIYDNPKGEIPDGAMGIVVGYFLPADDTQMAGLKKQ